MIKISKAKLSVQTPATETPSAGGGREDFVSGRYATEDQVASALGVSRRTVARWCLAGHGPPRIKIGKVILFDLAKLPDWLAMYERQPVRLERRS
ncbi:helix-turn-helix transcriptional regulator [Methylobacterium durans]|uniref:helix-turn-helix transcriptional regulator n=1 Tax=Methylobacterium durans TaxID=2202825 RepID=UPI003AAC46BC